MNRVVLIIYCLISWPLASVAQIFVKSEGTKMIEESVLNGVVLISQEYQLEDTLTHKRYSIDNKAYFGCVKAFAVKTSDGIITSPDLLRPWEKDDNFKKFKGSVYKPVLSKTEIRMAYDSIWTKSTSLNPTGSEVKIDSLWVHAKDTSNCGGFVCDSLRRGVKGWLVWLVSGNPDKKDSLYLETMRYRYDSTKVSATPVVSGAIMGGIFIAPSYEYIGHIVFKLCGILYLSDGKWIISPVLPVAAKLETREDEAPVLTPAQPEDNQSGDDRKKVNKKDKKK